MFDATLDHPDPRVGVPQGLRSDYLKTILSATYSDEMEAVIAVAAEYFVALNHAYTNFMSTPQPGKPRGPGSERRSPQWREAEGAFFAAASGVAAGLHTQYPSLDGERPIAEAKALIRDRVGPLCNGWRGTTSGQILHAINQHCPVHQKDTP